MHRVKKLLIIILCTVSSMPIQGMDILDGMVAHFDIRDNQGKIPLHHAAGKPNNAAKIKKLIQPLNVDGMILRGCDVNAIDNAGNTPLHIAARSGYLDNIKVLLDQHADPQQLNGETFPPIVCAFQNNHHACVVYIKEQCPAAFLDLELFILMGKSWHGSDPDDHDKAIELIKKGANPNICQVDGATLLFDAKKDPQYMQLLFDRGFGNHPATKELMHRGRNAGLLEYYEKRNAPTDDTQHYYDIQKILIDHGVIQRDSFVVTYRSQILSVGLVALCTAGCYWLYKKFWVKNNKDPNNKQLKILNQS